MKSKQSINRSKIYQLLHQNNALTKKDIMNSLEISLPTVTQNINFLCKAGLTIESGSIGNTGGRRAKLYSIVKDARIAIGLDITRNLVTAVAVDLTGNVISKISVKLQFERSDDYYKHLGEIVSSIIDKESLDASKILGVGLGVPGLVTADNQSVFYGKILNFTGATCEEFSKYIPYKVLLYNDANAAGFAEFWSRKDHSSAFYLMLSNNIGGSIVLNGQVYTGNHFHSGEVGHMTLFPDGKPCYCGQKGCVDAYLAATILSSVTDGNLFDFFTLLEEKDPTVVPIWERYLDVLALTVNNLEVIFDCKIILGGYVGAFIGKYIDDLKKRVDRISTFEKGADFLELCYYTNDSIASGAALNFISSFIDSDFIS